MNTRAKKHTGKGVQGQRWNEYKGKDTKARAGGIRATIFLLRKKSQNGKIFPKQKNICFRFGKLFLFGKFFSKEEKTG